MSSLAQRGGVESERVARILETERDDAHNRRDLRYLKHDSYLTRMRVKPTVKVPRLG